MTRAQQMIFTSEDSLQVGFNTSRTVLSGYGSASLEWVVLFVGHQFNNKFSFFSEMEIENALVAGMEAKEGGGPGAGLPVVQYKPRAIRGCGRKRQTSFVVAFFNVTGLGYF